MHTVARAAVLSKLYKDRYAHPTDLGTFLLRVSSPQHEHNTIKVGI